MDGRKRTRIRGEVKKVRCLESTQVAVEYFFKGERLEYLGIFLKTRGKSRLILNLLWFLMSPFVYFHQPVTRVCVLKLFWVSFL